MVNDEIIYRAVSKEELNDILIEGIRNKPGAYETVKLFALNYNDAKSYGLINQFFDDKPFEIISVLVPKSLYSISVIFHTDGMDAIAIEEKCLTLLKFVAVSSK